MIKKTCITLILLSTFAITTASAYPGWNVCFRPCTSDTHDCRGTWTCLW